VTPDGELEVVAEGRPNGLAAGRDNALYLTNNGGHVGRDARLNMNFNL
jgi:hypothetical protein